MRRHQTENPTVSRLCVIKKPDARFSRVFGVKSVFAVFHPSGRYSRIMIPGLDALLTLSGKLMKIDIDRLGLKNVPVNPDTTLFTFPQGLAASRTASVSAVSRGGRRHGFLAAVG